jgi:hypothetical protein
MHVDPPEPFAVEAPTVDEPHHFRMIGNRSLGQGFEQRQNLGTIRQKSAGKFTHDKRMTQHLAISEQRTKSRVAATEVIHPDRRVGQDHAGPERRRGIGRNFFCDPPSSAKRRALSRAIRASRPRWMSAVFSCTPVRRDALLSSSSFRFRVVLMHTSMHKECRCVERQSCEVLPGHTTGLTLEEFLLRPVARWVERGV